MVCGRCGSLIPSALVRSESRSLGMTCMEPYPALIKKKWGGVVVDVARTWLYLLHFLLPGTAPQNSESQPEYGPNNAESKCLYQWHFFSSLRCCLSYLPCRSLCFSSAVCEWLRLENNPGQWESKLTRTGFDGSTLQPLACLPPSTSHLCSAGGTSDMLTKSVDRAFTPEKIS